MTRCHDVRKQVLLACFFLAMPALVGCSANPVTGRRELILVSRDQEIAMGREAAPKFEQEFGGRVPNETLQRYVRSVGAKIAATSDWPVPHEYTLVASDVPNAFALPGGPVFITAGLVRRMTNERQLAAVLAHETAHVAARHSVKQMQKQMGAQLLVEIAGRIGGAEKGGAAADIAKIVATMGTLKYSRDYEYQADAVGIRYAARAGYNPWGMVELLTVLKNLAEREPGTFGEMFQTHPVSLKRVRQAEQILRSGAYARWSPTKRDPGEARFMRMRRLLEKMLKK